MTNKSMKRKLRKTSKLNIWAYISGKYQDARKKWKAAMLKQNPLRKLINQQ